MPYLAGYGEGQRVIKTETADSESKLPVKQSRILRVASVELVAWLIAVLLLIGPDAGVVLGYAALGYAALRLARIDWQRLTPHPRLAIWASRGAVALAGAAWYWWGWELVLSVWLPVYFVGQRMYLGRAGFSLPCPYWLRVIVGLFVTAFAWPGLVLAIRMVIELLDSNWPPTYTQRDAGRGPWMPWHKPYTKDAPEPEKREIEERDSEEPIGVRFLAPLTEFVDLAAVREYGREDAEKAWQGNGNGNGVGHV